VPVPNVSTIKNTAEIVKASNSHFGVCFDVDGSRVLVIDENGLEKSFEELFMLFVSFDPRIQKSKGNTILTTPEISSIVRDFVEDSGYPIKTVKNLPGEISRQIRAERACFAAADTLKFYFPQFAPFSDGCFILLKLLQIMTKEDDLLSSLTRGFPKGIKINRTVNVSEKVFDNFHIKIRDICDEEGYKYRDIINDLKIIGDNAYTTIKLSLNRKSIFLSAESDDTSAAREQINDLERIIKNME
jgi:phosphomannomutase